MKQYDNDLLEAIKQDRANGLTYEKIISKHNLPSNNTIKVAMGKTLGSDKKYDGRHKERFNHLKQVEKDYNRLVKALTSTTLTLTELFLIIEKLKEETADV